MTPKFLMLAKVEHKNAAKCDQVNAAHKKETTMSDIDHTWVIDVFRDLREYSKMNGLEATHAAITHAVNIAFWEIEEDMAPSAQKNTMGNIPYSHNQMKDTDWTNVVMLTRRRA
jgi:hypothetical protein